MIGKNTRASLMLSLVGIAALSGCAQQIGDIDRTYNNKISKDVFEGEWYIMQTVVDVNATAVSNFTGLQGDANRINWEITEDHLVARRAYEDVIGADTASIGIVDGVDAIGGSPVAIFPIRQHFDIQRQYNTATGEETNVIVENTFDRQWWERDYMRLDWRNAVLSGIEPMANVARFTPQDEIDGADWRIEYDENGVANYVDVVNTYIVEADWLECIFSFGYPNWGAECGPETIEVRTSMMRIQEDADHIPRQYNNDLMDEFGFFRTSRCVMDRNYGCRDTSRAHIAHLWDIWERSTDAETGEEIPYAERTEKPLVYYLNDEFPADLLDEAYQLIDEWNFAFRRTVAGAKGVSMDEVGRMFYLCLNPGTTDPSVPEGWAAYATDDESLELMTAAFESSAEGYAQGYCEREGVMKEHGDIRYSFINWVNNHPGAPWLGYGPSAADGITGQIINGNANINGSSVDSYAQYTVDIVRVLLGELEREDFASAEYLDGYYDYIASIADDQLYYGLNGLDDQNKNLEGVAQLNPNSPHAREITRQRRVADTAADYLNEGRLDHIANTDPDELFQLRNVLQQNRRAQLAGTPIEAAMITDEEVQGLGGIFQEALANGAMNDDHPLYDAVNDDILNVVSPLRESSSSAIMDYLQHRRDGLLEHGNSCIMMGADMDPWMFGYAQILAELVEAWRAEGVSEEKVWENLWFEIRGSIFRAVTEHEVGHTMGLRHNFEASRDAMNFHPQYWALRERTFQPDCDGDGAATFEPGDLVEGTVAPRTCEGANLSSPTDETDVASAELLAEIRRGQLADGTMLGGPIHQYQYASIMDYDAKPYTHNGGLGLYDYAAIAFGYGELVEVFEEAPYQIQVTGAYTSSRPSPTLNFDVPGWNADTTVIERGTNRVSNMWDVDNVTLTYNGTPTPDAPVQTGMHPDAQDDDHRWGHYHYSILPMMFFDDTAEVAVENTALAGYHPILRDGFEHINSMAPMYNRRLVNVDETGDATRVNYRFCTDERRGSGARPECRVWDLGVDDRETLANIRDSFEGYYIADYFRRDRASWGLWMWPLISRAMGRYFEPALAMYKHTIADLFYDHDAREGGGFHWFGNEHGSYQDYIAMLDSVNFVAAQITAPTPGTYARNVNTGHFENISEFQDFRYNPASTLGRVTDEEDYLNIGIEDGARYGFGTFTQSDYGSTPYWGEFEMQIASHFWVKWAAIESLVDGNTYIVGADAASDQTALWIPPYLVFPDEMTMLFGDMITGGLENTGWCIRGEGANAEIEPSEVMRSSNGSHWCLDGANGGAILNPFTERFGNRDLNIQIRASIYSAAEFQATFDKDWMDNAGVWVYGTEGPAVLPESVCLTDADCVQQVPCENASPATTASFCSDNNAPCTDDSECDALATCDEVTTAAVYGTCQGSGYELISYSHSNGVTISALAPPNYDPASTEAEDVRVGADIVQQLIDFRVQRDFFCPFEFANNAQELWESCNMRCTDSNLTDWTQCQGDLTTQAVAHIDQATTEDRQLVVLNDYFSWNNDLENAIEIARFHAELIRIYNSW